MAEDNKGLTAVLILAGAGIGAYFLLREKEDVKKGFNITNYTIPKNTFVGSEIVISIIAQNNLDEEIDGFCRIIDLDTQEELYYDHAIVGITDETKMHTFNFATVMPNKDWKLRITTGLQSTQEVNSVLNWTINLVLETGNLQGTVTDANTGSPINNALVMFSDRDTQTNSAGFYEMIGVPNTTSAINFLKLGYVTEGKYITTDMTAGEVMTVNFSLVPEAPPEVSARIDSFTITAT